MKIFVLSTIILGRKNYVATQMSNRNGDNKKIVNYTSEAERAKDFGSTEDAQNFIPRIVNPYEREYTAEEVEVDEEKVKGISLQLTEEEIK